MGEEIRKILKSDWGSPFCKKGLPGPLPKNFYNCHHLREEMQSKKQSLWQAG